MDAPALVAQHQHHPVDHAIQQGNAGVGEIFPFDVAVLAKELVSIRVGSSSSHVIDYYLNSRGISKVTWFPILANVFTRLGVTFPSIDQNNTAAVEEVIHYMYGPLSLNNKLPSLASVEKLGIEIVGEKAPSTFLPNVVNIDPVPLFNAEFFLKWFAVFNLSTNGDGQQMVPIGETLISYDTVADPAFQFLRQQSQYITATTHPPTRIIAVMSLLVKQLYDSLAAGKVPLPFVASDFILLNITQNTLDAAANVTNASFLLTDLIKTGIASPYIFWLKSIGMFKVAQMEITGNYPSALTANNERLRDYLKADAPIHKAGGHLEPLSNMTPSTPRGAALGVFLSSLAFYAGGIFEKDIQPLCPKQYVIQDFCLTNGTRMTKGSLDKRQRLNGDAAGKNDSHAASKTSNGMHSLQTKGRTPVPVTTSSGGSSGAANTTATKPQAGSNAVAKASSGGASQQHNINNINATPKPQPTQSTSAAASGKAQKHTAKVKHTAKHAATAPVQQQQQQQQHANYQQGYYQQPNLPPPPHGHHNQYLSGKND